jgi:tetratricopeptide (TPR) repeat protein
MSFFVVFVLTLMFLFLLYTLYRYFRRRTIATLITLCGQVFILTIAVLCLAYKINVVNIHLVELGYIILGIAAPFILLLYDYITMISDFKRQESFEGLVQRVVRPEKKKADISNINSICREQTVSELLDDLNISDESIIRNIRRHILQAQLYINTKNYNKAYSIYKPIVSVISTSPSIYYNLGNICFYREKYNEAISCYKKVINIYEELYKEFKTNKIRTLKHKKRSRYLDIYNKIQAIKNHEYKVYYNIGNCLAKLNRFSEAREYYSMASELNPEFEEAKQNIAFCLSGGGKEDSLLQQENKV